MNDILKKTLTLSDALKISEPLRFNMMFKPIGSQCNLNCSYCYYLDKTALYQKESLISMELLEKTIKEYIELNDNEEITFDWHGGEPLLLGLNFFEKIVAFQSKYKGDKRILNTIQTNATLINEEFASFFKRNNFLVGVSIDGPEYIHDKYRKNKNEDSSFLKVLRGIALLHHYEVDFNTLTTVNNCSEGRGAEVYSFLKEIGSRYMQFMPVIEHVNTANRRITSPDDVSSELAPYSVNPLEYGKFMCDIFDIWVKNDVGKYYVSLFDSTLANYCGVNPGICVYSPTCGANLVMEHNGDIYPCDHFVYPQYKLGNVNELNLSKIASSKQIIEFGINKRNSLPRQCLSCEYYFACHGECPKHRFDVSKDGEPGLNSLCAGLKHFFKHVDPYMKIMKQLIMSGKAPSEIMKYTVMS